MGKFNNILNKKKLVYDLKCKKKRHAETPKNKERMSLVQLQYDYHPKQAERNVTTVN
jgi:hypothetical protein